MWSGDYDHWGGGCVVGIVNTRMYEHGEVGGGVKDCNAGWSVLVSFGKGRWDGRAGGCRNGIGRRMDAVTVTQGDMNACREGMSGGGG